MKDNRNPAPQRGLETDTFRTIKLEAEYLRETAREARRHACATRRRSRDIGCVTREHIRRIAERKDH